MPGVWHGARGCSLPAVLTPTPVCQLCAAAGLLRHLRQHRQRNTAPHHRLTLTTLGRLKHGLEGAGLCYKRGRRRRLNAAASHLQDPTSSQINPTTLLAPPAMASSETPRLQDPTPPPITQPTLPTPPAMVSGETPSFQYSLRYVVFQNRSTLQALYRNQPLAYILPYHIINYRKRRKPEY